MNYKTEMAFMLIMLISLAVPLLVGYILISYIKSLESKDCACSNDRRRKYVKFWIFLNYISVLSLILILFCIWFSR